MENSKVEELVALNKFSEICDAANELAKSLDYQGSIDLLSFALELAPFNPDLRHVRGRKYIGAMQFEASIADLKLALVGLEGDWECPYYLAVSYYLSGQYEMARKYHRLSMDLMGPAGIEAIPAAVDWIWMSSMKLGDTEAAAKVLELVDINTPSEDGDYMARVLLYKGVYTPDDFVERHMCSGLDKDRTEIYRLMLMYGLSNYYKFISKEQDKADSLYKEILKSPSHHNLFAYIQSGQELEG